MSLSEKSASPILFGSDPASRIVAAEFIPPAGISLFRRKPDGSTECESIPFLPFLWVARDIGSCEPLDGSQKYGFLRRCESLAEWTSLRSELRREGIAHFSLGDPVQQYLLSSGRTLFHDLAFEQLRRLQITVETASEAGRIHPDRDPLLAIAVGDETGFAEVLPIDPADSGSTPQALRRLNEIIRERDPDVIEGHHLFKVILPSLAAQAKRHKVKLLWGRDESAMTLRKSRLQIAEKVIDYARGNVFGRHLVDTAFLAQFYDIGTRSLESFDLASVADHFGLPEAVVSSGGASFPDRLAGELSRTRSLAAALSASYFHQARIFPYNYQDVVVRGNATKIDSLFLREYFRRGFSIPEAPEVRAFEGGYTDVFFFGVAKDVWHCDVTSLYPSVMLQFGLFPATDVLEIFRGLLTELRTFRLEAKARMREATDPREQRHFDALQGTFKILINSFYGYLGFAQGHFADFDIASAVTAKGRELLGIMVENLRSAGAEVIEIDTDGIYFRPPPGASEADLQQRMREVLPAGIDVEFDCRYPAMFSYKAKNYALLNEDGTLIIKGAALKSRGLEKFQRIFLERMLRHLLEGEPWKVESLRAEFEHALRERIWPVELFAKTEALQDSPAAYQRKISASSRNRSAAFELAIQSGDDYQAGDPVSYYITGSKKMVVAYQSAKRVSEWNPDQRDENVEYYVSKLNDLAAKFRQFTEATLL